jgi:hypothetical protein
MAKWHGRNSYVAIADSGSTMRVISGDVSSIDAPSDQDIVDVSGFGDSKKNYVTGLADTKVSLKGQFNDLGAAAPPSNSGAHGILSALIGGTTGYLFKFGPKGSASGYPMFQGSYLLSKYNITSAINGAVMFDADLVPFGTAGGSWTTFP